MNNPTQQLENFFDQYARRFNRSLKGEAPDVEETAQSFTAYFIESSPLGVIGGKNDEQFRSMIPQGFAFYKSIGITSMDIVSKEISLLNDYHAMVKINWRSCFSKRDNSKGEIEFDVIYLLQLKDNECKIFAYITGDEQKALKENGLI